MTENASTSTAQHTVTVIGGGQIGEALVSGLAASGETAMTVTNRRAERRAELAGHYGVSTTDDNAAAVKDADVVFLCVKPYAIVDVATEIADALPQDAVVVSLAAGVLLETLEAAVVNPVVRVMPNTPMLLARGMSIVTPGSRVSDEQLALVRELMDAVGETAIVEEKNMDAATALSGSSPAYFFLVADALIDAGVALGVPRDTASKLVNYTLAGSGEMLINSGSDASTLRANVTSPGGTTAAAIRELEESGLRGAFYRAAEACANRAAELG